VNRACGARNQGGGPCGQPAGRESELCFWHDPQHEEAAKEARRLGGQRRRREATVKGAYDLEGLGSVADIRRVLEIAITDVLGMENTVPRARALFSGAQVAAKLLETGEFEDRLAQLESLIARRTKREGRPR